MKFSELIDMCIECVKTFNPVINTIDSHADDFLSSMKDPYEKVFVKQIFYGCIRYQDFLKVFTTQFFMRNPVVTRCSKWPSGCEEKIKMKFWKM